MSREKIESLTIHEILEWFSWNCPAISEEEIQDTFENEPEVIHDWIESIENDKDKTFAELFVDDDTF